MKNKIMSLLLAFVMVAMCIPYAAAPASAAVTLYWPVPGHTSLHPQGWHDGNAIDVTDGAINGAPVIASIGGTVVAIHLCTAVHSSPNDCSCGGFGTGLIILGDDNRLYQYAHMLAGSIPTNTVYYHSRVEAGQQIGCVGSTGCSTGPHLHFAIANSTTNAWAQGINPANESYIYTSGPVVGGGGGAVTPSMTVTWSDERCEPSYNNTFVYIQATPTPSGAFGNFGITMWDAAGNVVAAKTEKAISNTTYVKGWYNITEELGVVLDSSTKYTYSFFVEVNGVRFDSPVREFSTLANPACDGVNSCPSKKFSDMPKAGSWSHDSVDYVVGQGLFGGIGNGKFAPSTTMSRAMLVTVLHRYAGSPTANASSFTDVKRDSWYSAAVDWASENGIVNGVGGNRFDPNGTVTREQIASILCRYAEKIGRDTSNKDDLQGFADRSKITNWAYSSVQWAVANGIISGVKSGESYYVKPTAGASRAEVATMLVRFIRSAS